MVDINSELLAWRKSYCRNCEADLQGCSRISFIRLRNFLSGYRPFSAFDEGRTRV
jgi:hypothetical protein